MSVECEKCRTEECIVIGGFLHVYNEYNKTNYHMISCPDKDDLKYKGKKPDGVAEDKETAKKMLIEVKEIYHSEAKNESDILRTKEKNRNELFDIISNIIYEIINIHNLDNKFMTTINVYNPIGRHYIKKIKDVEFIKKVEGEILSKQYFKYEDEKIKIEIEERCVGTDWLGEDRQVLFCFPTRQEKGKENGMSLAEIFEMIEDYDSVVGDIERYIKEKCVGKFDKYSEGKRIILFDLKIKFGMEIMFEVNDKNPNMGFSFERLKNVYQKKIGARLKEYADEIWIMHMENKYEDEYLIRMIELT